MYNWDDIRLFSAIYRASGLAGAATVTGASAATLGRRITGLEQELGVRLFERERNGYSLTPEGEQLLSSAKLFEEGDLALKRWQANLDSRPVVRVAAGAWTSMFLAQRIGSVIPEDDSLRIELLTGVSFLDLSRRQANVGIRNQRPKENGLATKRLGKVDFAVYASHELANSSPSVRSEARYENAPWIGYEPPGDKVPSSIWLERRLKKSARLLCSAPRPTMDAAIAGVGLAVLPSFVGDSCSALTRVSEPISELSHHQWLVSHDEDRHHHAVRHTLDQLERIFCPTSGA